jgi:hypothetical protein
MDANIATGLLLEVPNEFDQPTVDWHRVGPRSIEGRRCRDMLGDPVDEGRERLDVAARPELHPFGVGPAAEDDRILVRDLGAEPGVHRVVPAEEGVRGFGNAIE